RVGGLFLHDRCSFEMLGPGVTAGKELLRTPTLWLEGPRLPLPDSQRQEDYPRDMAGRGNLGKRGRSSFRASSLLAGGLPDGVEAVAVLDQGGRGPRQDQQQRAVAAVTRQ